MKSELSKLKAKLIFYFNKYIRLRDSKQFDFLYFKCIACGQIKRIKTYPDGGSNYHASHYIHNKLPIQFDEDNCHGGCDSCNTYGSGNLISYRFNLINKIGLARVERLEIKQHNKAKYTRFEYEELIKEYKKKILQIKE
jgi:hypothetical protein